MSAESPIQVQMAVAEDHKSAQSIENMTDHKIATHIAPYQPPALRGVAAESEKNLEKEVADERQVVKTRGAKQSYQKQSCRTPLQIWSAKEAGVSVSSMSAVKIDRQNKAGTGKKRQKKQAGKAREIEDKDVLDK